MEAPEINKPVVKRPFSLSLLCILTFISSGSGCISSLMTPLLADSLLDFVKSSPNYDESLISDTIVFLHAGWPYFISSFLISAGSLTGAILMWKLKKIGFHFYALSNLGLLFLPTIFLGLVVSWSGILLVAGFIALYGVNLKFMS